MLFGQVKLPAEHAAHQFEKKRFFAGEDMKKELCLIPAAAAISAVVVLA